MIELCKAVVQNSITFSGLPLSPGLRDDECILGWSGRRIDGVPENFFANVYVCVKELAMGLYIEVGAYGYDLYIRDVFSTLYWGRTITEDELENNKETIIEEIKNALAKAWNDLPQFPQKIFQEKEGQKRLLELFRREGKLIE